jgi:hypothetical protein
MICGECETVVHGVQMMLNLHSDWVVLQWIYVTPIIQCHNQPFFLELRFSLSCLDQFFPFVQRFSAHPSPLYIFYISRHEDLIIISFELGTQ